MLKRYLSCLAVAIATFFMTTSAVEADTDDLTNKGVAFHFLNNETDYSDYKLTEDSISNLHTILFDEYCKHNSRFEWKDETDTFLNNDSVLDYSSITANVIDADLLAAKTYLLSHNALNRSESFEWNNTRFQTDRVEKESDSSISKSDFLVTLCKAGYGSIESTPVVLKNKAVRNSNNYGSVTRKYWENGKTVTSIDNYFSDGRPTKFSGDYYVYVTTNVYELYFKELIDKGVILKSDFLSSGATDSKSDGEKFIEDYDNFSQSRPSWYNNTLSFGTAANDGIFGYSFTISDNEIKRNDPHYFGIDDDKGITTLDALKIIERYMRLTEKEMTSAEADVISYKYGVSYLRNLNSEEYKTVSFLVAKGVLNFEEPSQFINLYGVLSYGDACKLIYRVVNKDARFDFSKIQLTDSESFWQEKGFAVSNMNLYTVDNQPIMLDVDTPKLIEGGSDLLQSFLSNICGDVYAASAGTYRVIKEFDTANTYYYHGKTIQDLANGDKEDSDIESIDVRNIQFGENDTVSVYYVTFTVKASSPETAVATVNSNISAKITSRTESSIAGVTRVEDVAKNGQMTMMISQSTIKTAFKDISILEDKVLLNENTNTMACILPDSGYALIGSEVIKSDSLMITESSGEIYYDMSIIYSLLCNTFYKDIGYGSGALFEWVEMPELETKVISSLDNSTTTTKAYYLRAYCKDNDSIIVDEDSISSTDSESLKFFYRMNSINDGINTIYRTFTLKNSKVKMTVIMDLTYTIPSDYIKNASSVEDKESLLNFTKTFNGELTLDSALELISKRPSNDPNLAELWDSNLAISNALANMIYGTKGKTYITNGYLMPNVTVLYHADVKKSKIKSSFLQLCRENDFGVLSKYNQYINDSAKWADYYFSCNGMTHKLKDFAKNNRKIRYYANDISEAAWGTSSTGKYFNKSSYYLASTGVLYRSLSTESKRMTYELSGDEKSVLSISINTGTSSNTLPSGNTICYFHGNEGDLELIYLGKKGGYLKFGIRETDAPKHKMYNLLFGKQSPLRLSCKKDIKESWNYVYGLYQSLFGYTPLTPQNASGLKYSDFLGEYNTNIFADIGFADVRNLTSKSYVYTGSSFKKINPDSNDDGEAYLITGASNFTKATPSMLKNSAFLPVFYLPTTQFYLQKDDGIYYVKTGATYAALTYSNIYFSGLNRNLIDSLLANSEQVKSIDELKTGSKLCINDTVWTKTSDGYWQSSPLANDALIISAKKYNMDPKAFYSDVKHLFGSTMITCEGYSYWLMDYITEADVGKLISNKSTNKHGVVCRKNKNTILVWKNKSYNNLKETMAKYVSVKIKLSGNLMARPLNSGGTTWALLCNAKAGLYADYDTPFFNESLSYSDKLYSPVAVSDSTYEPSEFFLVQRDAFQDVFTKAFAGDIWSLVKLLTLAASCYISVISWIVYCMVTLGYGRFILESIAMKQPDGSEHGVDIIKLMTFGIYRLDEDPTLARVVVVTFVCVVIDYLILTVL